jgi:hypothetical protein
MDNRLNKIRSRIKIFRAEMSMVEGAMRKQIAQDQDCTTVAKQLLTMRKDLAVMIEEFTALGGPAPLPTLDERLKRNDRLATKRGILGVRF